LKMNVRTFSSENVLKRLELGIEITGVVENVFHPLHLETFLHSNYFEGCNNVCPFQIQIPIMTHTHLFRDRSWVCDSRAMLGSYCSERCDNFL
jgi:hypothetical protein